VAAAVTGLRPRQSMSRPACAPITTATWARRARPM
jgi:hypothetical protein